MLSISELAKKSRLSRKTIYKVFYGTASLKSVQKVKKSLYKLTGQVFPIKEITKGKFSDNSLIKSLCKDIQKSKKVSLINSRFESFCADDFYADEVYDSDYSVRL